MFLGVTAKSEDTPVFRLPTTTIVEPIDSSYWVTHLFEGVYFEENPFYPKERRAVFAWYSDFDRDSFEATVDLRHVRFEGVASFRETVFNRRAIFNGTTFDTQAVFHKARFGGFANFRRVNVKDSLIVAWSVLPDTLDFRDAILAKPVDFTKCLPPYSGKKCRIALFGVDLEKVIVNMEMFSLWFPTDTVGAPSSGSERNPVGLEVPRPEQRLGFYEQFLKSLQKQGFLSSYESVDKEYQRYRDWDSPTASFWGKLTYWPSLLWWDFGYAKGRVFLWSLGSWLIFTFSNLLAYNSLRKDVYSVGALELKWRRARTPAVRAICHFLVVAAYTAHVFFGLKLDARSFPKGVARAHPFKFGWVILIYLIGLICVGYIANFIFSF